MKKFDPNDLEAAWLTGLRENLMVEDQALGVPLHSEVLPKVKELQGLIKSESQGSIELALASGFRSFERQLLIWNEKVTGKRAVLDDHGKLVEVQKLNEDQLIDAILRWSALPGASRHHWGTELDVFDGSISKKDPSYRLKLIPEEYSSGGPFETLNQILEKGFKNFERPYLVDEGGIHPEPWHLSYTPLSQGLRELYTFDLFLSFLNWVETQGTSYLLLERLQKRADEIYHRYIL